jgi:hypothetical protein
VNIIKVRYPLPCRFRCPTQELAIEALKVLEDEGILWANGDKPTVLPYKPIYSLNLNESGKLLYSHNVDGWNYDADKETTISINAVLGQSNKATVSDSMLNLF